MKNKPFQIAIDGPAASGKSTVGKLLADELGYLFFDTGLMYRIATYAVIQNKAEDSDVDTIAALTRSLDIQLQNDAVRQETIVLLNGKDISEQLHTPEIDAHVSIVAAIPAVREVLTDQQRKISAGGNIVVVGRDIGTVVLPDADLKIYLSASAEKRAERRFQENIKKGIESVYAEILNAIHQRDQLDSTRAVAPLKPADDAVIIDTDELNPQQVVAKILQSIHN